MTRRAVFLDRDGVINEPVIHDGRPYPPSFDQLVLVPWARESLIRLRQKGFLLIVVTNQPDVRRKKTTQEEIERIHRTLSARLPLDDFFTCFHDDGDACDCRKPLPGLIRQAAAKYDIELENSYVIGDRWRDIDAGAAIGCRTVFIDKGYKERMPERSADKQVLSIVEAVDWILVQESVPASTRR